MPGSSDLVPAFTSCAGALEAAERARLLFAGWSRRCRARPETLAVLLALRGPAPASEVAAALRLPSKAVSMRLFWMRREGFVERAPGGFVLAAPGLAVVGPLAPLIFLDSAKGRGRAGR